MYESIAGPLENAFLAFGVAAAVIGACTGVRFLAKKLLKGGNHNNRGS